METVSAIGRDDSAPSPDEADTRATVLSRAGVLAAAEGQIVADLDPHRLAGARKLLSEAQRRAGWVTLKGKRPGRAEALFLAADDPERGILAYDNIKMLSQLS